MRWDGSCLNVRHYENVVASSCCAVLCACMMIRGYGTEEGRGKEKKGKSIMRSHSA